ncbi:MAG: peptidylprolyl isomerase [Rhodospirillaceae bacterium]|nr:peptidylprolyl isomerase [Rhodospirillaceae bacterium]
MFRDLIVVIITLSISLGSAATARSIDSARIAAIVNNSAITVHDVDSRMALVFMSARIRNTPETRRSFLSQVLNQLIVEALQMQEAERMRLAVSDREVAEALAQIEKQNRMPSGRLFRILEARKVNPLTLVNQVKASIVWSKVIQRSIASRAQVSDADIDEAIARFRANKNRLAYRILEIYISSGSDGGTGALRTAQRLIAQIRRGADFSALARQFSQSSTAGKGGDMGIVFEGQLAPELERAIKRVRPGQIIGPVRTSTGYYLLALESRRAYGVGKPPTRKQVADSIFQRKVRIRARQHLRDLRRNAFVEIRI